jgi:Ner family transcriptional regulator
MRKNFTFALDKIIYVSYSITYMKNNADIMESDVKDWPPEAILAALRENGTSLLQLASENGYSSHSALYTALRKPYPKCEVIIAEALNTSVQQIWPERYAQRQQRFAQLCGQEHA